MPNEFYELTVAKNKTNGALGLFILDELVNGAPKTSETYERVNTTRFYATDGLATFLGVGTELSPSDFKEYLAEKRQNLETLAVRLKILEQQIT